MSQIKTDPPLSNLQPDEVKRRGFIVLAVTAGFGALFTAAYNMGGPEKTIIKEADFSDTLKYLKENDRLFHVYDGVAYEREDLKILSIKQRTKIDEEINQKLNSTMSVTVQKGDGYESLIRRNIEESLGSEYELNSVTLSNAFHVVEQLDKNRDLSVKYKAGMSVEIPSSSALKLIALSLKFKESGLSLVVQEQIGEIRKERR